MLLMVLLNFLYLLPSIGYPVNTPFQPVDARMLIFSIDDKQVILGPEDIEDIDIGVIHLAPIATVEITLNPQAAQAIHDLTAANIGKRMEVHWNGRLLKEDFIEEPLDNEIYFSNLSVETAYDFGQWVTQNKQDNMDSNNIVKHKR